MRYIPLDRCSGFIDGTLVRICRPAKNQRKVFNGHKRVHAINFNLWPYRIPPRAQMALNPKVSKKSTKNKSSSNGSSVAHKTVKSPTASKSDDKKLLLGIQ